MRFPPSAFYSIFLSELFRKVLSCTASHRCQLSRGSKHVSILYVLLSFPGLYVHSISTGYRSSHAYTEIFLVCRRMCNSPSYFSASSRNEDQKKKRKKHQYLTIDVPRIIYSLGWFLCHPASSAISSAARSPIARTVSIGLMLVIAGNTPASAIRTFLSPRMRSCGSTTARVSR